MNSFRQDIQYICMWQITGRTIRRNPNQKFIPNLIVYRVGGLRSEAFQRIDFLYKFFSQGIIKQHLLCRLSYTLGITPFNL